MWKSLQIPRITFSYQQTPLHVATSKGRDYTVEYLVKKGADKNIKDKNGVNVKLYLWLQFSYVYLCLSNWLLT